MINKSFFDYDWSLPVPLEYYYTDGRHVKFDKYEIYIWGEISHKQRGVLRYITTPNGYHLVNVVGFDMKQRGISIARSVLSSFYGKPRKTFTADHIDPTNKAYDALYELQWASKIHQSTNQIRPGEYNSALIIVKNGVEKTAKEWGQSERVSYERIKQCAQQKINGFSYKEYLDLPGEKWKNIEGSKSSRGRWEISNMNRVARVTRYSRNVFDETKLCLQNGYPSFTLNGKTVYAHIIAFRTWFPELWEIKKPNEIVCHRGDNKLNFQPKDLYLGTPSQNICDAHDNGKYIDAKTKRRPCSSYINGVFEKHYTSLSDAVKYLKLNGKPHAVPTKIGIGLDAYEAGKKSKRYGRVWVPGDDKLKNIP